MRAPGHTQAEAADSVALRLRLRLAHALISALAAAYRNRDDQAVGIAIDAYVSGRAAFWLTCPIDATNVELFRDLNRAGLAPVLSDWVIPNLVDCVIPLNVPAVVDLASADVRHVQRRYGAEDRAPTGETYVGQKVE